MRFINGFRLFILTVAATSAFIGIASGNVLLNPGFESGLNTDADDWQEFGGPTGSTTRSGLMPNTGSFSAYMQVDHINNTPAAVVYFIQQVLPVGSIDNAKNYNFSFSAKVDSLDFTGIDMFYQIQWIDQDASNGGGVKGESLTQLIPAGINTSYQQFGVSDINVPDGADSVLVRLQLSPGPIPNIVNGLYVDDVNLSAISSQQSGDFDMDGDVDGADFLVWQRTIGTASTLIDWQNTYGTTPGLLAATTAVPEPSTLLMLMVSCLFTAYNHRRI